MPCHAMGLFAIPSNRPQPPHLPMHSLLSTFRCWSGGDIAQKGFCILMPRGMQLGPAAGRPASPGPGVRRRHLYIVDIVQVKCLHKSLWRRKGGGTSPHHTTATVHTERWRSETKIAPNFQQWSSPVGCGPIFIWPSLPPSSLFLSLPAAPPPPLSLLPYLRHAKSPPTSPTHVLRT